LRSPFETATLEQLDEFAHSNAGLPKNRRKRFPCQFPMKWDNDRSATLIAKCHMTTSLADWHEAGLRECGGSLLTRNDG
jgi:hypothetical protein